MQDNIIEPVIPMDTSDMFLFGLVILLLVSAIMIGGAIATGIVTGLTATIGLGMFVWKTKKHGPKYWNWMIDNPVKTDIGISVLFFATMVAGATLGGLVAGTSAVVFSSAGINGMKYLGRVEGVNKLTLRDFIPTRKAQTIIQTV